jgi:hypothetical protein
MKKCYDTILFDVITILVFSLLICVNFSVPGQPRNLHANVLSPNRIEVTWSPPTDYADIRSYIVYNKINFAFSFMKIFLSSLVHYIPSQPAGACKQESLLGMSKIAFPTG